MPKIETKFCDECAHAVFVLEVGQKTVFHCSKGHKPKFYKPTENARGYIKFDWGYKRRCEDFEPDEACAACGQAVDKRDLGQVFHHEEAGHKPLQLDA